MNQINKTLLFMIMTTLLISCATSESFKSNSIIKGVNHHKELIQIDTSKKDNTIIVFMSSRCPCSESHNDILKDLSKKYSQFQFLGIHSNFNERLKHAKKYFDKVNFNFPVIYDSESKLAKNFGALKTPHVFILNKNSKVIYSGSMTNKTNGRKSDENYLALALEDLKQGKAPRQPKRKVLGCYIPIKE